MTTARKRLGINAKAYLDTADPASWDSPTWSEWKQVRDFEQASEWDAFEFTSRESPVKIKEPTLIGLSFTGQARKDPANAVYAAIEQAHKSNTAVHMLILDAARTEEGAVGVKGWFKVTSFSEPQNVADGVYNSFTIEPCLPDADDEYPQFVIVEAGPTLAYYDPGTEPA